MLPDVPTFQALVRWLADAHHRGAVYRVATSAGLAPSTAAKWRHGYVKAPRNDTLRKLCAAYDLPFSEVVALPVSDPPRRPRRGGKALRGFLLAALMTTLSGVPVSAEPSLSNLQVPDKRHYVKYAWRRLYAAVLGRVPRFCAG